MIFQICFSDGCGRSGTYICLDANLQLAEEEGVVDIFNYTKLLRESRKGMIENEVKPTTPKSIYFCLYCFIDFNFSFCNIFATIRNSISLYTRLSKSSTSVVRLGSSRRRYRSKWSINRLRIRSPNRTNINESFR